MRTGTRIPCLYDGGKIHHTVANSLHRLALDSGTILDVQQGCTWAEFPHHFGRIDASGLEPGDYSVQWDGNDCLGRRVSSGVYFYRLTTPQYSATRKMVILK